MDLPSWLFPRKADGYVVMSSFLYSYIFIGNPARCQGMSGMGKRMVMKTDSGSTLGASVLTGEADKNKLADK